MPQSSRERMERALTFRNPDKIPVVYHPSRAGLYVHGEKLLRLFQEFPDDTPIRFTTLPQPPPTAFDPDGRYHEFIENHWGTVWEYRIYGIQGHPRRFKYPSWRALLDAGLPPPPNPDACQYLTETLRRDYLPMAGGGSLLETLTGLRPMEEVLISLLEEDPDLLAFLDRLTEHHLANNANAIAAGSGVGGFGDDFGTQQALLFSPDLFREVFKPRFRKLFAPFREAGRFVMMHSCGAVRPLLDDFIELGMNLFWPQLSLYGRDDAFLDYLRERRVSLYLHPDRQRLIPLGAPAEITDYIRTMADRYHAAGGGGIFYIEIENDAPFENVDALIRAVHRYR